MKGLLRVCEEARIRGGASLVGDPGTGRENLDSLRLVCPESE